MCQSAKNPSGWGATTASTVVSQGESARKSARESVKKGRERGLTIWAPCLFERFREERTRAGGRQRLRVRASLLGVGMVRVGPACVLAGNLLCPPLFCAALLPK